MSEAAAAVAADPAPPAALPDEPAEMSLDDGLGEIEPPPDGPGDPAPDEPVGDEPAPAEGEPAPAAAKADDKEDFSDERPWTPERIKSAVVKAKELARAASDKWVKAEKREGKFDKKLSEYKKDRDLVFAMRDQILADVRLLEVGGPAERIAALGRLAKQDGHQFYEALSLGLAGKKADPKAQEIDAVKAELAEMKREREEERQAREQGADVFGARQRVLMGIRDPQRFPLLAKATELWGVAETAATIEKAALSKYGSFGQRVDIEGLLVQAEYHLRSDPDLVGPGADQKQPPAGSGPDAGREPSAAAAAKPEMARRTPGKSVTPSISTTAGTRTRSLEDGESVEELANDPSFLSDLGLR
jgi:hypothetical protein